MGIFYVDKIPPVTILVVIIRVKLALLRVRAII